MTDNQNQENPLFILKEKIQDFAGFLIKKIAVLVIVISVSVIIGISYYYIQRAKYEGTSTFILEEKSSSLGGIAGIASQFGLDIGSMGGGSGIFAGDNILDIMRSGVIVQKVLLSKVPVIRNSKDSTTLADLYLNFSGFTKKHQNDPSFSEANFKTFKPGDKLSLLQDSILNDINVELLKKYISVDRMNKKGSIIKVQVVSESEVFSKYMAERLVIESRDLYVKIKTGTTLANVTRLENRVDSLSRLLNAKSYQVADLQILDVNTAIKRLNIPSELSQRDKSVITVIYTEVVKNLEMNRMVLSQQTPIIQLLDGPEFPLVAKKRKLSFCILVGGLVGALFGFMYLGLGFLMRPEEEKKYRNN